MPTPFRMESPTLLRSVAGLIALRSGSYRNWGNKDSLPALREAAEDPNKVLRMRATKSIEGIIARSGGKANE